MAQPILPVQPYAEYLDQLERSQIRLEFLDGIVYAMAGGTPRHNKLCARIGAQVGGRLGAGCEGYSPDQRIRAQGAGMFADYTVVCGPEEFAPDDPNAIVNPALVVEVSSPSTDATDRTTKAERYKGLSSLKELVLVWQNEPHVQVHCRTSTGWEVRDYGPGESASLLNERTTLDVDALYRGLDG